MEISEENIDENYEEKIFNIRNLVVYFLILVVLMLSKYYSFFQYAYPLIILLRFFISLIVNYYIVCSNRRILLLDIFNRGLLLSSIYLFFEFIVKCIPIIDLLLEKVLKFPLTGNISSSKNNTLIFLQELNISLISAITLSTDRSLTVGSLCIEFMQNVHLKTQPLPI